MVDTAVFSILRQDNCLFALFSMVSSATCITLINLDNWFPWYSVSSVAAAWLSPRRLQFLWELLSCFKILRSSHCMEDACSWSSGNEFRFANNHPIENGNNVVEIKKQKKGRPQLVVCSGYAYSTRIGSSKSQVCWVSEMSVMVWMEFRMFCSHWWLAFNSTPWKAGRQHAQQ